MDPDDGKKVLITSLDCSNKGYDGLEGATLYFRYKIVKRLNKGVFGQIYMIEDLKENKNMSMKLQEDTDMASIEIATMKKISIIFDTNKAILSRQDVNYDATPRVSEFGQLKLVNFEENKKSKEKLDVYYIMPLYEMDLEEYLKKFQGS